MDDTKNKQIKFKLCKTDLFKIIINIKNISTKLQANN